MGPVYITLGNLSFFLHKQKSIKLLSVRALFLKVFFAISLIFCLFSFAFAGEDCVTSYYLSVKIETRCENRHNIPLGAGVASPSVNSSHLENPSGLIYNSNLKIHGSISRVSSTTDDTPVRKSIFLSQGNGSRGLGFALHHYSPASSNSSNGSINQFSLGFAQALGQELASGLSLTFAARKTNGFSPIRNSSQIPLNFGTLVNPKGDLRTGFTLYDSLSNTRAFGIGVSKQLFKNISFATDVIHSIEYNDSILKTTFGTSLSILQLTAGFGARLSPNNGALNIPTGLSLGLGVWIGKSIRFVSYLNQLESIYLGLTVSGT